MTVFARRAAGLVMTGGGTGDIERQLADIAAALRRCGSGPGDICVVRAFYRAGAVEEPALAREIAALTGGSEPFILTMVPALAPGLGSDAVSIEAVAVVAPPGSVRRVAENPDRPGRLVLGIRRGRFAFTSAERAPSASGLVEESGIVMERLGAILAILGITFSDVVRMNRWYCAAGTRDAWMPSALKVASFYREPGPVATAISIPVMLTEGRSIQIELMGMAGESGEALPKAYSWPAGHWDWPTHLPYRHGVACGGLAFVGGQVSLDEKGEVIDPDHQDAQVGTSVANIRRVLGGFGVATGRLIHLGAYFERERDWRTDSAAALALGALRDGDCPVLYAGFPNLSYPAMRVEIEAVAEIAAP